MKSIYPQELWNSTYSNRPVELANATHPIVRLLHQYIPNGNGNAIELGCCPGMFLGHLGIMGYTLHGIDLSPSIMDMEAAYKMANLPCGTFKQQDFFDFCRSPDMAYDIVTSYGFIEHFIDFEEAFFHHCRLVNDNGYIVVTFPNFLGNLQFALHTLFDKANLDRHNLKSMELKPYVKMLNALHFDVLFAGYFGGFSFWRENSGELPNSPEMKALYAATEELVRKKALVGDSPSWSCFGGIVGKRRSKS